MHLDGEVMITRAPTASTLALVVGPSVLVRSSTDKYVRTYSLVRWPSDSVERQAGRLAGGRRGHGRTPATFALEATTLTKQASSPCRAASPFGCQPACLLSCCLLSCFSGREIQFAPFLASANWRFNFPDFHVHSLIILWRQLSFTLRVSLSKKKATRWPPGACRCTVPA